MVLRGRKQATRVCGGWGEEVARPAKWSSTLELAKEY